MVKKAKLVVPEYTREKVNHAGNKIASGQGDELDYTILNNWRASHNYPLNMFQATLRSKITALKVRHAIVSQRIKREESITAKLQRYPTMKLAQMQDIGGLRAVVSSINDVVKLADSYRNSKTQHELYNINDYVNSPKQSGYRSMHLMFKYCNARAPLYNNLKLEIQIRTKLQHYWANAVETVGTYIKHSLKSSHGPDEWLQFFALCGEIFARKEKTASLHEFAAQSEGSIIKQCSLLAHRLNAIAILRGFSAVTLHVAGNGKTDKRKTSHLVILDLEKNQASIRSYFPTEIIAANLDYSNIEKRIRNGEKLQAVLVSTDSINALKRAYPSYFLDSQGFLKEINTIFSSPKKQL